MQIGVGADLQNAKRIALQFGGVQTNMAGNVRTAFAALLAGTPLRALLSADFETLAWRKLLINAIANPITALTLQRQAVLRRDDIQALCRAILDEAVAVARADGARLAVDEATQVHRCTSIALPDGRCADRRESEAVGGRNGRFGSFASSVLPAEAAPAQNQTLQTFHEPLNSK